MVGVGASVVVVSLALGVGAEVVVVVFVTGYATLIPKTSNRGKRQSNVKSEISKAKSLLRTAELLIPMIKIQIKTQFQKSSFSKK